MNADTTPTMPDAPTPLDLDAIVAAIAECRTYNFGMYQADRLAHEHAPALVEEVKRLRAEVAVTARPAPAWDEDAVAEAVRRDLEAAGILPWTSGGARIVRTALAVVRDHQPVKPDRETVAWAVLDALDGCIDYETQYLLADAILDLLPGRSEAEVKAEALREARDAVRASSFWADGSDNYADRVRGYLSARAEAWDEGAEAMEQLWAYGNDEPSNPYREGGAS